MAFDYTIVFFVSLFCICLELFFTRILNLKTWNHVVYVIVPFAILGYGIGANIYLIFRNKISKLKKRNIIASLLFVLGLTCILTVLSLIYLPVHLRHLIDLFVNIHAGIALSIAYTVIMLPFVIIGFLVIYLFSENPKKSNKLYFWDLFGAGCGAIIFFFLINWLEVFHSLVLLSMFSFLLCIIYTQPHKKWISVVASSLCFIAMFLPEPANYNIDKAKRWEYIPGFFEKYQYEHVISKWSPLGRTDAYRFKDEIIRNLLYNSYLGTTFEINLLPPPEFSYFCTNFLSGTPVYKLSKEGLDENNSIVRPFSQAMEFPYLVLKEPKVVIIGTGGGRDIFMAKTHNAKEIIGAEINPVIYSEMTRGGRFYEYSGKVYDLEGVNISNLDGRHLVKKLKPAYFDLVLLNGVDTFSGLSSGAYAYAESYLYTKEALLDYLRVLNDQGIINFNRWFFSVAPRETLRLFVIALDALRSYGIEKPWEHIIVANHRGLGMMLIKKIPFSSKEKFIIKQYFQKHMVDTVFPSLAWEDQEEEEFNPFKAYVTSFIDGEEDWFIDVYPYDISVVYDNAPFFYKYYKLKNFHPKEIFTSRHPVTGTVIFLTQILVLIHAIFFIILFILFPLFIFKRDEIKTLLKKSPLSFIVFFSCLGAGFMFIEIPFMQRFTLLLGNPIYSISVTLAALLIFCGVGSLSLTYLKTIIKDRGLLLTIVSFILAAYLGLFICLGTEILDYFMHLSFIWRIIIASLILFPLGLCLGVFFPSGLQLIGRDSKGAVAWAWGINSGFTVLGSMLAIILAQFYGFNLVIKMAVVSYLIATLAFRKMYQQ